MHKRALAFDCGGTKVAWAIVDEEGNASKKGSYPTPQEPTDFLAALADVISTNLPVDTIGLGMPGIISANHEVLLVSPNLPLLNKLEVVAHLKDAFKLPVALDNDARCALIGEVWLGAAKELKSAVMLTIGTGVGGAVMQYGNVLPHPKTLEEEIGHLIGDPNDHFPASAGRGSVEGMLGGKNLEERFGIPMEQLAKEVRSGEAEAVETWETIAYYFMQCLRAIRLTYSCRTIIIGGRGLDDLEFYLQETPPCPVIPAALGKEAGVFGAARLAFDALEEATFETDRDWDE